VDAGSSYVYVYTGACAPLSVGTQHACGITPSGGVKCWGDDASGQRGYGNKPLPGDNIANDVVGLTSGVACVAAGGGQTCALTKAGAVKCWGDPWNGATGQSAWGYTPVDVPGLSSGVIGLASGMFDTCALLADGGVQCWGGGADAEFGTNTMYGLPPQTITGVPSGAVSVQMSDGFGCVLTNSGAVDCWGGNTYGELGNGSTFPSVPPVPVTGLGSGITSIWANGGVAACAVVTGGSLKCWGDGPTPGGLLPVAVTLPGPVRSVSAGAETACALLTDGSVYCWPDTTWPSTSSDGGPSGPPTRVSGLPPAQFIAVNPGGKCALAGGKVYCWSAWWTSQSSTVVEVTGF
jgi:alpha-tubulin suppressor-like RCC1 family protein